MCNIRETEDEKRIKNSVPMIHRIMCNIRETEDEKRIKNSVPMILDSPKSRGTSLSCHSIRRNPEKNYLSFSRGWASFLYIFPTCGREIK